MKINSQLPKPAATTPEQQLREVAEMYEKNFMREMYKSMRATVPESNLVKTNQAEKIFREQLDDHYIDQWGKRGGAGLADIIYKDLIEKYGARLGIKSGLNKIHGPIGFREKDNMPTSPNDGVAKVEQKLEPKIESRWSPHNASVDFKIAALDSSLINKTVEMPWEGYLTKNLDLGGNLKVIGIDHPNGLRSTMSFRGALNPLRQGQLIPAGTGIAELSPDAKEFWWNVAPREALQERSPNVE